jgi:multidrug resistance efflux pump
MLARARSSAPPQKDFDITPPSQPARETSFARAIRLSVAIPLFAVSLAALFPFAVLPVSTQAVVNARLSRVRAARDGEVAGITLETGDIVLVHQRLAFIEPSRSLQHDAAADEVHTRGALEEEITHVHASLISAQLQKTRYDDMYHSFTSHRASELEAAIHEAERNRGAAASKLTQLQAEVKRDRDALNEHLIPKTILDQAEEKLEYASRDVTAKESSVAELRRQLSDVQGGYTLSEPSPPQFLSQRDEVEADVARYQQEESSLKQRMASVEGTSKLIASTGSSLIESPVSGPIWARSVASGQIVSGGDDLFRIADTASIHVEVWLDRRYGPELSVGDTALVYLTGIGKELQGKVIAFEGTSRRRLDEEVNAIDLQPVHQDQYHVTIELQPKDRQAMYMGQSAKVLFPGSQNRLVTRFYFWLTRI